MNSDHAKGLAVDLALTAVVTYVAGRAFGNSAALRRLAESWTPPVETVDLSSVDPVTGLPAGRF